MSTTPTAPSIARDTYAVGFACAPCAVLIGYGDESATESPERVEEVEATAAAIARDECGEVIVTPIPAYLAPSAPVVFRCPLCGDDAYGPAGLVQVARD
ncbi:hypothetical protein [Mobilicoccus caccae]|uniref:Uncharacterized protein n=1 Tax=Mobilicoccus caccae TaxID=1859295 RepID=A0ABQ6IXV4_9MICO|nr:hypothetical protein [Mobilicoccus caccae]GMA42416.1 hypothetical protein GCM10025883_44610 [Mobilicoccus caccae]